MILAAFGAESQRLSEVVAGADDAAFARPSPCAAWTVAELVYHVQMTMGWLPGMLTAPEPAGTGLVSAAAYYRPDQRFSAAANAGRIRSAQRWATALPGAAARARDFDEAWQQAWNLLPAALPGRVVRTRHGDRMLLTEFLRTRPGTGRARPRPDRRAGTPAMDDSWPRPLPKSFCCPPQPPSG
jgi:uncharacterized protein (TIGR03083 family)